MKKVTISPLVNIEQGLLQKLKNQDLLYFPDPWSEKAWQDSAIVDDYHLFWIEADGELVSWALIKLNPLENLVHILKIMVVPKMRGQGFGFDLLHELIEWSKNLSVTRCYLEVDTANSSAVTFYKRQGFKILHEIKTFYSDGRNAFIMELNY